MKKPENLTMKQWAFVCEYPKDWNATQAAIRAGYSQKTAAEIGWQNLRKLQIREALSGAFDKAALSREEVFFNLAEMANGLPPRVFEEMKGKGAGGILDTIVDSGYGHLVKSFTFTQFGGRIELYDRKAALELIGKGHAAFTEKHQIDNDLSIVVRYEDDGS